MGNEKDYDKEDDSAIREIRRRIDRQEAMAEASNELVKKFAKDVFKNKQTRNSIARDCIEGIQGRKPNVTDPRKLAGRDGARVPNGLIDDPLPTGFEKMPWEDSDE